MEFTTRQLKITRVYAPHLWKAVLTGSIFFVIVFFGGILLVTIRAFRHEPFLLASVLLFVIYMLGSAKAFVRWKAVKILLAQHRDELKQGAPAHLFLWPFASLIYLYNATAAALSRKIVWRGITYELKSPEQTVITKAASSRAATTTTARTRNSSE